MVKKIKRIFQIIIISALIGSMMIVPVSAKNSASLQATDFEHGMETLGGMTEEEWASTANGTEQRALVYDGDFIEAGNSNDTEGHLQGVDNAQIDNYSLPDVKGLETIGNPINQQIKDTNSLESNEVVDEQNEENISISNNQIEEVASKSLSENVAVKNIQNNEIRENVDVLETETDVQSVSDNNIISEKKGEKTVQEENETSPIETFSAPTVGLEPFILNPESLRDGMITTETEIAWIFTGDATEYYYGGFQSGYINQRASDGFTTIFYTPGTYSVLCYGVNAEGESSEVVGFNITIVPEFDCQVITDSVTSATDSKSFAIDIDFTAMDTAAVCLVRTGKSEVQMKITDNAGTVLQDYPTIYEIPKRWIYIDKPSSDAQICHYTINITTTSYNSASGDFRVIVGNKNDAEAMMGGMENAVDLELFYDSKNNYIFSTYMPRGDEYWFITSMPFPTVFTLLSNNRNLRFKLKDMDTLEDVFDSNDSQWSSMHSTKFTGSYSYAEKVAFEALTGKRRYLVLYTNSPSTGSGVLEDRFCLGAGQPMYGLTHQNVYGSSMTVGASTFASQTFNTNISSIANTGVINEVSLSGVSLTKLDKWRLMAPNTSSYKTSTTGSTKITYNFTAGGQLNTGAKGTWDFGVKLKSGNSSISCYPSLSFSYYYQYGDNTITIVPAN